MLVRMQYAKTHLSELVERALNGEEVVIARGAQPLVRLVPVAPAGRPRFGALRDLLPPMTTDDFAWSDEELIDAGLGAFVEAKCPADEH